MKIYIGLAIIAAATLLSFVLANLPTGTDSGLGGIILLLWPPIVGIAAAIAFLVLCAFTRNKKARLLSSLFMAIYIIYVGLGLYVDNGWPLVY